jgi:hypothetical protein
MGTVVRPADRCGRPRREPEITVILGTYNRGLALAKALDKRDASTLPESVSRGCW